MTYWLLDWLWFPFWPGLPVTEIPILYTLWKWNFFILNQVWGINFITEGFADFCSKKSFITNVQLFLLYRCVRKWFFPKYCPHFFFYNFDFTTTIYSVTSQFTTSQFTDPQIHGFLKISWKLLIHGFYQAIPLNSWFLPYTSNSRIPYFTDFIKQSLPIHGFDLILPIHGFAIHGKFLVPKNVNWEVTLYTNFYLNKNTT